MTSTLNIYEIVKYLSSYDLKSFKPILGTSFFLFRDIIDPASANYQTYEFYNKIGNRHNYGKHLAKSGPIIQKVSDKSCCQEMYY